MARIEVTEAGYHNGHFIPAGGSYDAGEPVADATEDEAKAKPAKKKTKAAASSVNDAADN
ncbi:MAG: hypothetical protein JWR80_8003 [Bradyrhizobium sp.]|nr:hypothetical protein [Bradyrhizobium sp.]